MPEHKNLSDSADHCHTPQGFSSASNDTVLSKDGSGTLEWISTPTVAEKARCCMYSADVATTTTGLDDTFQLINEATLGPNTLAWVEKLALPVSEISTSPTDGYIRIDKTGNFLLTATINTHADGGVDSNYRFTVGRYLPSTDTTVAMNNVVLAYHQSTDTRVNSQTLNCVTNTTEIGERYYLMVDRTSGSGEIVFDHINFTMTEVS